MIFDGHAHLFHPKVISNVQKKGEMVKLLGLQAEGAEQRVGAVILENELRAAGVEGCLVLPTAQADEVGRVNEGFYRGVEKFPLLHPAGTLHPGYGENREELIKFISRKIRAIKMCSFSQKFALDDSKTLDLFELISWFNQTQKSGFFVILDTFSRADTFFGTPPAHNTTPPLLAELVKRFPDVNFIGAHMGGLSAPFEEIRTHLTSMDNLFLDTSNAAHVLKEEEFICLLKAHGPEHIIFGTDWPWFTHPQEMELQNRLFDKAGYAKAQRQRVFSNNMTRLLGMARE